MTVADTAALQARADAFRAAFASLKTEVGKTIVGQQAVIEGVLTAIFCGGNVLLEGVPGLGKTELVKSLAKALSLPFNRVQFTPDLMPADLIGTTWMNQDQEGRYRFEFRRGPIFTQLLLADEINRATPKTQSALLETMQEHAVTVGGSTHRLEEPYFVLATQNPLEQEGTYPLPEAQLDRFLFKLEVPVPDRADLNAIVARTTLGRRQEPQAVLDGPAILAARATLAEVVVADEVRDYAVRLVLATHPQRPEASDLVKRSLRYGASPRAAQALLSAGRVSALAAGRLHLSFADLRRWAVEVLQHRLILSYDGQAADIRLPKLIQELLSELPEEQP